MHAEKESKTVHSCKTVSCSKSYLQTIHHVGGEIIVYGDVTDQLHVHVQYSVGVWLVIDPPLSKKICTHTPFLYRTVQRFWRPSR